MPIIYLLLGTTAAIAGISCFKTIILLNAYRARRFDKVTQLLPSALEWSTQMNPFTYFQSIQCLQTQFSLLILEGRFSEFEALNRFSWAMTEKHKKIGTRQKNWAIASNLATAFFLQHNYDAAITIFYENLPKAKRKSDRLTMMCNLSYCLIKNNKIDEAERYLYEALELNGKNMESVIGMRLQFLSTYLQTEKGELDSAELSIQHASELSLRLKQPDDFRAYCNAAMAEIRRRQKRFDEAELYFRNAIDVLASADNPAYLDLAMMYRDYAQTLLEAGDPDESSKQMMRAHSCFDFYVKRETDTVNLMRERLQAKKPIRVATQLLNLGNRVKSIEVLDIR
jgi:tetratricopeptide (TPR) repeat protein